MDAQSAERFTAFGTSHQAALAVLVVGAVALVWAGRTLPRGPGEQLARGQAVAILAFTLPLQALYLTPAYWQLERSLPLQLCDLASLVAAYALWTRRPGRSASPTSGG